MFIYSKGHAYGAVLDNPSLLAVAVVGDGEAETGPLATSWQTNKFMTAIQNVLHGRLGYKGAVSGSLGLYSEDEKVRAFELLDEVGLGALAYRRADQLSGGQKQRVGIARSLIQEPKIVLADEPIASLDPKSSRMVRTVEPDDSQPVDLTKVPLSFPAPRSMILQALSRGLTQAVVAFGYAAIRGFGLSHPTVGELRRGTVPVTIDGPGASAGGPDDAYYLGSLPVCEVESLVTCDEEEDGVHRSALDVGYGLVMGSDESKAIAMSVLDHSLRADDVRYPTQDQEFVLTHIDGVEAMGFISHLKLPHYVTFQSKLDSALRSAHVHELLGALEHCGEADRGRESQRGRDGGPWRGASRARENSRPARAGSAVGVLWRYAAARADCQGAL